MHETTSSQNRTLPPHAGPAGDLDAVDRSLARRMALRDRHAQRLAQLMDARTDLRGVNQLADFVDDAIRWSA